MNAATKYFFDSDREMLCQGESDSRCLPTSSASPLRCSATVVRFVPERFCPSPDSLGGPTKSANTKFPCWLNHPSRSVLLVAWMKLLGSLIVLVPVLMFGATNRVPELPVETFFRNPELTQMRLSPDGKFVAAIT